MADKILNVRIQTRTDTEANWKSKNPVLLKGEVGITSDNKRYKVGDGTTAWSGLAYATLGWSDITDKPSSYPPSGHTHAISDVTNLQATLNNKAPSTGSTSIKTLASTITLGSGGTAIIDQTSDTYRQRIKITDNSTSNDEVFGFYQSTDSGSSYTNLFSIQDDGTVVAKAFSGTATASSYPSGFASRTTGATWGNQDGTVLTDWHTTNGGDIAFRENGGQLNVVIDGYYYQNEGRYKCLDTNNYSSYALPLSGGTMTGALKFANNTWNTVGDDASMGDHNIAGAFCIVGANGGTKLALCNKDNQSDYAYLGYEGGNILINKKISGTITTADTANSVDWTKVQNKPSTYTPAAHTQAWSTITDKPALMESGDYSATTIEALLKKVQGLSPRMGSCNLTEDTHVAKTWWNFIYTPHRTGSGSDNADYGTLLLFPMTGSGSSYIIRAAKNATVAEVRKIYTSSDKPTKAEIGLGNVDNTADANKSVKYATSAGSANTASTADVATTGVRDYGNANNIIQIGWAGTELAKDTIGYIAAYTSDKKIHPASKAGVQGYLGLGDAAYESVKNLSAVSHTGWTNNTVDNKIVPTMSFMAYWNGAYSSNGSSNLQYCDRGRLGTIVTKSTGDYLASTGGTLSGDVFFSNSGTTTRQIRFTVGDNDYARVAAGATATNAGWVELASADDGNEPVYVRQYTGVFSSIKRTATLLDSSGNTSFPGVVTAPTFKGALSGNADTASSMRRYYSGNTSSDKSGCWYKMASCSISSQYGNNNIHFIITDNGHGGEAVDYFEGIARLKQQAAMGSTPLYSIRCKGRYGLTLSNVKIVITANTTSITTAEVWAQIPKGYTTHGISIISNDGWTVNTNMALQQSLPTGTAKNAVDNAIVGTANIAYGDESGNNIKTSYGSSLTVNGRTVNLLSKSGATLATITTQDTNTWRGIQDNLTSTSTTDSLSANQGRVLATKISDHQNNKSNPHSVTKAQVGLGSVANILQLGAVSALGYYGMARPDGNTTDWIRTTSNGIIPYQSGSAGSGHSSLGTSTWYFSKAYIDNIFDSTGSNIKAKYVSSLSTSADKVNYTMGDGTTNSIVLGSIDKVVDIWLPLDGWTQNATTGRYTLSVNHSEIKSTYNALCVSRADASWNTATLKAYNKAFGIISSGTATTYDGSVQFSTGKKPAIGITIALYCTTASDSLAADSTYAVSKQYVDNQLAKYTQPGNMAYVNYTVTRTI